MSVEIELELVITLPREGIIITRYVRDPWQGFSLGEKSTLNFCLIASLTLAKAVQANGERKRDLVSFVLADRSDAEKFILGQHVYLRDVEPAGWIRG